MSGQRPLIPPRPEMAAYWQTFPIAGEAQLPLHATPNDVTDAIVAFAAPDGDGVLRFAGPDEPTREAVRFLRARGQNALLSIGGGGVTVSLDTQAKAARFSQSLVDTVRALGFNGVDIDVENGIPADGTPLCPKGPLAALIGALNCALDCLPPEFLLTLAPETANLVGGITRFGGAYGNYLPLLLHFGDRVTRVHMQYYNSGAMTGLDGQAYEPGTVAFVAALTDAVIWGFPIADTGICYPGLPPWKVSVGLPAVPRAAANGYLPTGEICRALQWLRTGYRGKGRPRMPPYRHLGGLMTWSLQWDATNNFAFVRRGARMLGIVR